MKNIMLPLIAVLLLAACQNSTNPAPETTAENIDAPAAITIDPAVLKISVSKAKNLLQTMNDFNSELTAASKSMSEAQKNEIEVLRSQLNDVMGKQEMLTKGLESADNAGSKGSQVSDSSVPTPGDLQKYITSVDRYESFLADLHTQLEAVKAGKSTGQ